MGISVGMQTIVQKPIGTGLCLIILRSPFTSPDHTFIHPFLRELSKMTPTRKAAPMFHMAKAATMSIT